MAWLRAGVVAAGHRLSAGHAAGERRRGRAGALHKAVLAKALHRHRHCAGWAGALHRRCSPQSQRHLSKKHLSQMHISYSIIPAFRARRQGASADKLHVKVAKLLPLRCTILIYTSAPPVTATLSQYGSPVVLQACHPQGVSCASELRECPLTWEPAAAGRRAPTALEDGGNC
jgi:hypothetical protein